LEALLTGLPIIINRRMGEPVPELEGDFVRMVENTEEAYFRSLNQLLTDHEGRAALGRRALAHARAKWDPVITEARYASIYRSFLEKRPG
jgi:glycosyltransferase involved in cell wall biosynthesis